MRKAQTILKNPKANNHSPFQKKNDGNAFIQPKLNVGKADDKYEKEADLMADTIVSKKDNQSAPSFSSVQQIQKVSSDFHKPEEKEIQEKPLSSNESIVPHKQGEEDEQLMKKEGVIDELQEKKIEEESIQEKSFLQKNEEPDMDIDDEPLAVQAKTDGNRVANSSIESQLNSSKGGGSSLPKGVKSQMESGFGTDFSSVRLHTDSNAAQMSKNIGAQAFTHGNDVYFNEGKYQPESDSGKHLLAHELTHTVQQGASMQKSRVQKVEDSIDSVERDFIQSEDGSLDLRGLKKEIHIKSLEIPKFKQEAGFYPSVPFRLPPKEERNTNQRQKWDTYVKMNDAGLDEKLDDIFKKQTHDEVSSDPNPIYYLKLKNAAYNLIGTKTEIKNRVLRPYWNESGTFQYFHVDHQVEYQLGGPAVDVESNYWLLDDKSNIGSGRLIKINKDKKLSNILKTARESAVFEKAVPENINDVRGTDYTIIVDNVTKDETAFDIKTLTLDEVSQGKTTEGLDLATEDLLTLRGSPNEIVIYFNRLGGMSRRLPWNPMEPTLTDLSSMSGGPNIGENFELTSVNYIHGSGGSISGLALKNNKYIKQQVLTMEMEASPIVEYGGVVSKRSLKAEANKLIANYFSPIAFSEIDIIPEKGIYAEGKIYVTLPIIEDTEIDILIDGNTVRLFKTFNTGEFNVPPPFEISNSSLTVFAGTEGLGIEGQVDFRINNVGEGYIGAAASTGGGFELEGAFSFDSELFDPAEINVEYKDDIWTIGGTVGIPEDKVRGIKNANITATYSENTFTANGEAELDIPGIQRGQMEVIYSEEGFSISGDFELKDDIPGIKGGSVSAIVSKQAGEEGYNVQVEGIAQPDIPGVDTLLSVSYDNGALIIEGSAAYNRGMLSGNVNIGATNRTIDSEGLANGEPDDIMRVYGGGDLTLQLTPWLQATAGVQFLPNGEIEIVGRIALPDTVDVFDRKELRRNLFSIPTIEIPLFAIPLGPRSIGLVAQIDGGLTFSAGFGPGQLRDVYAEVTYNPDREDETVIHGHGLFAIPADAGLTLSASLGLGVSIGIASLSGGIELAGTLGLEGEAAAEADLSWNPTTGVVLDAEGRITVNPKFIFDVNAFARATLGVGWFSISETWRHNLASFRWGPDIQFGIIFPVHYEQSQPFDIGYNDIEVIYPDLKVADMAIDMARDIREQIF